MLISDVWMLQCKKTYVSKQTCYQSKIGMISYSLNHSKSFENPVGNTTVSPCEWQLVNNTVFNASTVKLSTHYRTRTDNPYKEQILSLPCLPFHQVSKGIACPSNLLSECNYTEWGKLVQFWYCFISCNQSTYVLIGSLSVV